MVVDSWFVTELVLEQLAFVPCRSIVMLCDFNVDQLRRFPKGINKVQGWNSALSFIATRINDAVRECPEWLQAMNVAFTVVLDHHGTLKRTVLQALTDNIRQQCPADFDWMLVSREEYISKVGEEVSGHHTSFATE
jgi:lysyl-tRNA synthetase class I